MAQKQHYGQQQEVDQLEKLVCKRDSAREIRKLCEAPDEEVYDYTRVLADARARLVVLDAPAMPGKVVIRSAESTSLASSKNFKLKIREKRQEKRERFI